MKTQNAIMDVKEELVVKLSSEKSKTGCCVATLKMPFSYHQQHCYITGFSKSELHFLDAELLKKKDSVCT